MLNVKGECCISQDEVCIEEEKGQAPRRSKGPGSEEKFADSSYWRTKIRNRELLRSHRVEVLVQNLFDRILSIFA
eukprot:SAG31_NODE_416_length_15934_cov_7.384970_2_plen_75_part_00